LKADLKYQEILFFQLVFYSRISLLLLLFLFENSYDPYSSFFTYFSGFTKSRKRFIGTDKSEEGENSSEEKYDENGVGVIRIVDDDRYTNEGWLESRLEKFKERKKFFFFIFFLFYMMKIYWRIKDEKISKIY
jgi:hypothetical protein